MPTVASASAAAKQEIINVIKATAVGYKNPGGTLLLVGDSLIAIQDANPTGDCSIRSAGFIHHANYRLGVPFTKVVNGGVGATQTAAQLAALPALLATHKPNWVYILATGNNAVFQVPAPVYTMAQVRACVAAEMLDIAAMIALCQNAGAAVVLGTVIPRTNTSTNVTGQAIAQMMTTCKVCELANKTPGVYLHNVSITTQKFATQTNVERFEANELYYEGGFSASPVHLNQRGGTLDGDSLYDLWSKVIPRNDARAITYFSGTYNWLSDEDNGIVNAALFGTAGTKDTEASGFITGPVATNWNVDPVYPLFTTTRVACSKGTHWNPKFADVPTQVLIVTGQPAPVAEDIYYDNNEIVAFQAKPLVIAGSPFAAGHNVFFEMAVNVTETSGNALITALTVDINTTGSVWYKKYHANAPTSGNYGEAMTLVIGAKMVDGVIRTDNFTLPANVESVSCTAVMRTSAGANVKWEWAQPSLRHAENV